MCCFGGAWNVNEASVIVTGLPFDARSDGVPLTAPDWAKTGTVQSNAKTAVEIMILWDMASLFGWQKLHWH
jgi:LEA14-like dessication related protein